MSPLLPALRPGRALAAALAATAVLGLPLTVLPILDGLLFSHPGLLVARDFGLLLLLSVAPCLLLMLFAWGIQGLTRPWLGVGASVLAWSLLLVPLSLLLLRQTGRVLLQWLQALAPELLDISPALKLLLLAICSAALLTLMVRWGWSASLARVLSVLEALRPLAWLMLTAAVILLLWQPPSWKPMASAPLQSTVPAPANAPHVLLIAIDTVAAVDADACNPLSATMPRLAQFAQQATCFQRFQTASNFTTSSVSTMESGLLPWTHGANQPDASMRPSTRGHTVAAQLKSAGWRTHSVTDNLLGSPRHRGSFASYDSAWLTPTGLWVDAARFAAARFPDTVLPRLVAASLAFLAPLDRLRHEHASPYRSEAVYEDLHRLLAQERALGRPQFVFTLSLPPHAPYLPPLSTRYRLLPPGRSDRLSQLLPDNLRYPPEAQARVDEHRLRYRESLMAADAALGDALERLEREGWLDKTIVVITTDHGESFEKGFLGHAGPMLHQPLVQGPLVIRLPGQSAGRVIEQVVSQADLAPTLLDLAGAAPLPHSEGRSLRPLLEGRDLPAQPVFSMAMEHQSQHKELSGGQVAVVDGDWKLHLQLDGGQVQLFNLADDPKELHELENRESTVVSQLTALVEQRLKDAVARQRHLDASRH